MYSIAKKGAGIRDRYGPTFRQGHFSHIHRARALLTLEKLSSGSKMCPLLSRKGKYFTFGRGSGGPINLNFLRKLCKIYDGKPSYRAL